MILFFLPTRAATGISTREQQPHSGISRVLIQAAAAGRRDEAQHTTTVGNKALTAAAAVNEKWSAGGGRGEMNVCNRQRHRR